MLREFITVNRALIITRCRDKVVLRSAPAPTAAIDHGVPEFLDQLVVVLGSGPETSLEIRNSAVQHGHHLRGQGLSVSEVVHNYGDICQTITELAIETDAPITVHEFRTLNRCLDEAIAGAVTEYGRQSSCDTVVGEAERASERLGFFAHELRNLINTGTLAFEALETGNVGIGGSTSAVLRRSLVGLGSLVTRALAEVRLTEGIQNRETVVVSQFIDELAPGAVLGATQRSIRLEVLAVDKELMILADRQVLGAVVVNLLQNAFKFTKPSSTVTLRVGGSAERVLIEVEDGCGGLPGVDTSDLFRRFEQRGADRTGLGLGLAFCRWAVEANGGRIYARNLPGVGCVFTIDVPRVATLALPAEAPTPDACCA
jgi:signal transduction histidine kinase